MVHRSRQPRSTQVTAGRYDVVALLLRHTQWAAEPDGTQEDLSFIHNERISPRSTLHSHLLILQVVLGSEVTEDDCFIKAQDHFLETAPQRSGGNGVLGRMARGRFFVNGALPPMLRSLSAFG